MIEILWFVLGLVLGGAGGIFAMAWVAAKDDGGTNFDAEEDEEWDRIIQDVKASPFLAGKEEK